MTNRLLISMHHSNALHFRFCFKLTLLCAGLSSIFLCGCPDPNFDAIALKNEISELRRELETLETSNTLPDDAGSGQAAVADQSPADPADVQKLRKELDSLKSEMEQTARLVSTLIRDREEQAANQLRSSGALLTETESGQILAVDLTQVEFEEFNYGVLSTLTGLEELTLYGADVPPEAYEAVGQLTQLRRLRLEKTPTNLDNLSRLAKLENLEELFLFRSDVNDECCKLLARFPKLRDIRCGQTLIGDEGLAALAQLETLEALDLSDCTRVSDEGLKLLSDLPKLRFLRVFGKQVTDEGMNYVAKMKRLEVLGLNDTDVTDVGMVQLSGLRKLKELHLVRTRTGDKTLEVISSLPAISRLRLRDTQISDEGLAMLTSLNRLRVLDLSETNSPGVTDQGAEAIAQLKQLEDLNLWTTKVSDGTVKLLAANNPNLVRLNLDNTAITDATLLELAKMKQLTWLHIGSTRITDKNLRELMKLDNLKYLNISNTSVSEDAYFEIDDYFAERNCRVVGP